MAWFPPGADPVEHAALVPGIPAWLDAPLTLWVQTVLTDQYGRSEEFEIVLAWDTAMRNKVPDIGTYRSQGAAGLWEEMDEERRIVLVDFLTYWVSENWYDPSEHLELLETMLREAGSEWRVGKRGENAGLEKRVPQGVVDAAEAIMGTASTAGALLSEAWHAAFGREPNPEEAYEKAIKAVEEAGAEKVAPKNDKTTLGTMARDMEAQKDWALPLGDDVKHAARDVAYKMVRSLWSGQESRHGGNGYRKPTPEEAEAAVLLAVPLVQWFTSGVLQRRP